MLLVVGSGASAAASPVYSCPGNADGCAGQEFALYLVNSGAGWFDIAVSIDTAGYTGSEDDLAFGVEFKNVTDTNVNYSAISLLSAPGADLADWDAYTAQVQKCDGPDTKNDTGCAGWDGDGAGYDFSIGDTLTWVFHVTSSSPPLGGQGHLKYQYVDEGGKQVAGLLSVDFPIQDCRDRGCDDLTVPEPASMTLLGAGLLGAAVQLRRRRLGRETL